MVKSTSKLTSSCKTPPFSDILNGFQLGSRSFLEPPFKKITYLAYAIAKTVICTIHLKILQINNPPILQNSEYTNSLRIEKDIHF